MSRIELRRRPELHPRPPHQLEATVAAEGRNSSAENCDHESHARMGNTRQRIHPVGSYVVSGWKVKVKIGPSAGYGVQRAQLVSSAFEYCPVPSGRIVVHPQPCEFSDPNGSLWVFSGINKLNSLEADKGSAGFETPHGLQPLVTVLAVADQEESRRVTGVSLFPQRQNFIQRQGSTSGESPVARSSAGSAIVKEIGVVSGSFGSLLLEEVGEFLLQLPPLTPPMLQSQPKLVTMC